MKRIGILFLSFILCVPIVARGEAVSEDSVFAGLRELEAFVSQELEIIEEKMKELNPRLVESVANDSDTVKIIKYNNWMAEYIFDEYRDFFVWDLRQQSEKTGRKIRSRFDLEATYPAKYWLDRGIMETEQCNGGQYQLKDGSCIELEKATWDEREHTCLYPDGFEEYTIDIDDIDKQKIVVFRDNAHDNVRLVYHVDLDTKSSIGENNQVTRLKLWVSEKVRDYSEYQDWRNRTQQDIIDGKYTDRRYYICEPVPKTECYILGYKDGSCSHMISIGDWKNAWSSNRGIPGVTIHAESFDYSLENNRSIK